MMWRGEVRTRAFGRQAGEIFRVERGSLWELSWRWVGWSVRGVGVWGANQKGRIEMTKVRGMLDVRDVARWERR